MDLRKPSILLLPAYCAALKRGWSPSSVRPKYGSIEIAKIAVDAQAFVDGLDDVEAKGGPVTLPDGTNVPRLPGFRRWMWDDDFCGSIAFRWQKGTSALPDYVLGHIGYSVVPWKQGRGYAKKGLSLLLTEVRGIDGLTYVELTTDPNNLASRKVIEASGGVFVERFVKSAQYGNSESLRYRINL